VTVKSVFAPHLGREVKFGRNRPKNRIRLHMRDYLRLKDLPPPPTSADYSAAAQDALSKIFLNDQLGDCVVAAGYHLVGVETANANAPFVASDAQVQGDYSGACGYDPSNPSSDQGCNEQSVFQYWQSQGFADGTKLSGAVAIDGTNQVECKQSIYLFENSFFGVELPDAWVNSMPSASGFVWDVAGDPNHSNGHAFLGIGYNGQGVQISTWGLIGTITWAAIAKYAVQSAGGELYALLTPDQIDKAKQTAPNGLTWADLEADFAAIGNVAPPTPQPPVPPTPQPPVPPTPPPPPAPGGPTLDEAIAWATQGLTENWPSG
jgi:hypothetical protein